MSIRVKRRLGVLGIETAHEERVEIDRLIEERKEEYCDSAVEKMSNSELIAIVDEMRQRKKRKEMTAYV